MDTETIEPRQFQSAAVPSIDHAMTASKVSESRKCPDPKVSTQTATTFAHQNPEDTQSISADNNFDKSD